MKTFRDFLSSVFDSQDKWSWEDSLNKRIVWSLIKKRDNQVGNMIQKAGYIGY